MESAGQAAKAQKIKALWKGEVFLEQQIGRVSSRGERQRRLRVEKAWDGHARPQYGLKVIGAIAAEDHNLLAPNQVEQATNASPVSRKVEIE
jgi:hypothetical protein